MNYRLTPKARRDISAIMSYIGKANPGAALKWRDQLFGVLELLGSNPGAGSSHDEIAPGIRMFPKGNYLVLYRAEEREAVILRVTHAARDRNRLALV